jgi:hypothetical protein
MLFGSVRINTLCVRNARLFSFVVCDLVSKHNWTQFLKILYDGLNERCLVILVLSRDSDCFGLNIFSSL